MKRDKKTGINYSMSWEDADILLLALKIDEKDSVLSITSGGCNTLSLLSQNPQKLISIDKNPAQNHLFELKLAAMKQLSTAELRDFLLGGGMAPMEVFKKLSPELSVASHNFWSQFHGAILGGVSNCGRFENYLKLFRKTILRLCHSRHTVYRLLENKPEAEQRKFYHNQWNNFRWKMLFRLFFSEKVMRKRGRRKEMFSFSETDNLGKYYYHKTGEAFSSTRAFGNSYLQYILTGTFKQYPHSMREDTISALKKSIFQPEIVSSDLLDFLKRQPEKSLSKFNLSDVFEPMSEEKADECFAEIVRVAKQGSRIIFWNNLVKRDIPEKLKPFYKQEANLIAELSAVEKVFFYGALHIYTINK